MTNKNYFLIIIVLQISTSISGQNFWERIESPTDNFLRTVFFLDSLRGWVAGDSGIILYTDNGGLSWTQQTSNTDRDIRDIFFLDENRGWAVAWSDGILPYNTFILNTTNRGIDWTVKQYPEENIFYYSIYFLDTLNGFMGGAPSGSSAFVRTTDGGTSWRSVSIDTIPLAHFPVNRIKFYNSLYGYATGGRIDIAGVVWKTTDGGNFWVPIDTSDVPPDEIWDIHFIDSVNVLGCGGDPELYGVGFLRSTNAGDSWDFTEIGFPGVARSMSFRKDNEGWVAVPLFNALLYTTDYGYTWRDVVAPGNSAVYEILFTDSSTGYAVGQYGVILKYKYQQPDYAEEITGLPAADFMLYQNYPNPFNSSTTISYSILKAGHVSLKILNVLGIEINELVNSFQSIGSYRINWEADKYPSGIYLLKFQFGNRFKIQKLTLLK